MYRPTKEEWLLMAVLTIAVLSIPAGILVFSRVWAGAHSPEIREAWKEMSAQPVQQPVSPTDVPAGNQAVR